MCARSMYLPLLMCSILVLRVEIIASLQCLSLLLVLMSDAFEIPLQVFKGFLCLLIASNKQVSD